MTQRCERRCTTDQHRQPCGAQGGKLHSLNTIAHLHCQAHGWRWRNGCMKMGRRKAKAHILRSDTSSKWVVPRYTLSHY